MLYSKAKLCDDDIFPVLLTQDKWTAFRLLII